MSEVTKSEQGEELAGDDGPETMPCERCGKQFPVTGGQQCTTDTGPWCDTCAMEWHEHFKSCQHTWEPHQGDWGPGQFCTKCHGFVEDEDFAEVFGKEPTP